MPTETYVKAATHEGIPTINKFARAGRIFEKLVGIHDAMVLAGVQ